MLYLEGIICHFLQQFIYTGTISALKIVIFSRLKTSIYICCHNKNYIDIDSLRATEEEVDSKWKHVTLGLNEIEFSWASTRHMKGVASKLGTNNNYLRALGIGSNISHLIRQRGPKFTHQIRSPQLACDLELTGQIIFNSTLKTTEQGSVGEISAYHQSPIITIILI